MLNNKMIIGAGMIVVGIVGAFKQIKNQKELENVIRNLDEITDLLEKTAELQDRHEKIRKDGFDCYEKDFDDLKKLAGLMVSSDVRSAVERSIIEKSKVKTIELQNKIEKGLNGLEA